MCDELNKIDADTDEKWIPMLLYEYNGKVWKEGETE